MNQKKIVILSLITLGLLLVALQPYWQPFLEEQGVLSSSSTNFLVENPQQITQISFKHSSAETITLSNNQTHWEVDGLSADIQAINQLLNDLSSISFEQGSVVSTNPKKSDTYLVTPELGIEMIIDISGNKTSFIIGDSGTQTSTFYLKETNADPVYLISGNLYNLANNTQSAWRDKTITTISETQIQQIEINTSEGTLLITKNEDGSWQATSGLRSVKLGDTSSSRMLESLNPLTATGFASPQKSNEFLNALSKQSLQVTGPDGQITMQFSTLFNQEDNSYWGQLDQNPTIYQISQSVINNLILKPSDIFIN